MGDISVSRHIDDATNARSWHVTFHPNEGKSAKSLVNFGNLPPIEVVVDSMPESISVHVESVEEGDSPFQVFVSPAAPSSAKTTAHHHPGVRHFEGLSSGVYKSDSHFFIQSRDEFSNEIQDGPLNEVQIIETSSSSPIGGYFEISLFGTTQRVPASAFPSDLEKSLQSIPGVGALTVSSNSARDLVHGTTVSVTKGLTTIIPSEKLTTFIVGDWIRIENQDGDWLFAITDMAEVAPFTTTLSSPFLGDSDASSSIYQHGSHRNRNGYQYIVTFDHVLGDVPSLDVNGALLEGDAANVEVTSCDWNVYQTLRTHATGSSPIEGYFYLAYGTEQTRMLRASGTSAEELKHAILSDITCIHSLSVTHEQDHGLGTSSWTIHLKSFDGSAQLFLAAGHLISAGTVATTAACPTASQEQPQHSAKSVAGRRGQEFVVALDGPTAVDGTVGTVHGTIAHLDKGRYMAQFVSPRVGEYSLSVRGVSSGGLFGEYFNNRWLYGEPTMTRVDQTVDFQWGKHDAVTPTGKDFVSVRWNGYIKPAFSEIFTFTAHVNDALRLWIGDELLIDDFDNEVNDDEVEEGAERSVFAEFSASTAHPLQANQLVAVKIEYRENRGSAMIRLFWESVSQPFAIIDHSRVYYNATHIHGSPFDVTPTAIEPTSPTQCSLVITSWDSLEVSWSAPEDDGGTVVNKYLIESWDANEYGVTEKQQLQLERTIVGSLFALSMLSHSVDVPVGASAPELEKLIESLPNVGDVEVLKTITPEVVIYDIEFLTNKSPVPVMAVSLKPNEYCVCAKASATCDSGSGTCAIEATREGTVSTLSQEVVVDTDIIIDHGARFSQIIDGLIQPSNILEGFGVRVSAGNSEGYGIPCAPVFSKPKGPPLPPLLVELERVPANPSSLALHFTSVTSPDDKGSIVNGYVIEWSIRPFQSEPVFGSQGALVHNSLFQNREDTWGVFLSAESESIVSNRLPLYKETGKTFNYYLIEDLIPGAEYFVRIAAVNEAGIGPSSSSLSSAPGFKPTDIEDQNGVTLATVLPNATVSVMESSSTLRVSWRPPFNNNGFDVSMYLIEYWVSNGVSEIQEMVLHPLNGSPVQGTFTLSYGEDKTDSLSIDSSAEDVKLALETLSSIRSVRIWRSGENPHYTWRVTFLSEYPSTSGTALTLEDATTLIDATGGVPMIQINVVTPGVLPIGYSSVNVSVDAVHKHHHHILSGLTAGQPYYVQVSAANQLGYGRPRTSIPLELAPPVQKPSSPTNVILTVASRCVSPPCLLACVFTFS